MKLGAMLENAARQVAPVAMKFSAESPIGASSRHVYIRKFTSARGR